MKISARSSGGFAGLEEHYEIDTERHPQGGAIAAALASAGFFAEPPGGNDAAGADLRHWQITVETPGAAPARHSIRFAEDGSAANARWQELVARLRAAA